MDIDDSDKRLRSRISLSPNYKPPTTTAAEPKVANLVAAPLQNLGAFPRANPGDFRRAEERSNESFYSSQNAELSIAGSRSLRVSPTPESPAPTSSTTANNPQPPVKTATLDIILFDDEATPIDTMADLIFENIGGQELINITRSDIVNGQKISYQPIKNLSSIQQRYNPNNILSLQQTSDKYFSGFPIKLEEKIPTQGGGPNGTNVYIDSFGDLIIEFINMGSDEQIETQITVGGTIYEIDLGEES